MGLIKFSNFPNWGISGAKNPINVQCQKEGILLFLYNFIYFSSVSGSVMNFYVVD